VRVLATFWAVPNDKDSRAWVLTELFVLLVREVTLLLGEHDAVGLVHAGAPRDEYDVGQIVRRVLGEALSPGDVERIVSEVLSEYFGDSYAAGHADVSERIWRGVQQAKRTADWATASSSIGSEIDRAHVGGGTSGTPRGNARLRREARLCVRT
jgi:hypothetical protein